MKKSLITAVTMLLVSLAGAWADGVHYTYNGGIGPDEHVIFVALADTADNWLDVDNFNDGTYYLGAFIGGECRGEAVLSFFNEMTQEPYESKNLFMLRVRGNGETNADAGKTITFRIFKQSDTGEGSAEYFIPYTAFSIAFQKEGISYAASQPYPLHFVPATSVSLPYNITANFGELTNLFNKITTEPEDALIPYPINWVPNDTNYISVSDNSLTINSIPEENYPLTVSLSAGEGLFQLTDTANIVINNPAKVFEWTDDRVKKDQGDGSKGSAVIALNEGKLLMGLLKSGYNLTGRYEEKPATTLYTWTSSKEDVISQAPTGGYEVKKEGTTILKGTPSDGSTETSPELTVTVIKPVTGFTFGNNAVADTVIVLQVGDNVTKRLKEMVNVVPADATNQEYTIMPSMLDYIELNEDSVLYAKSTTCDGLSPVMPNLRLTITAEDGFNASNSLWVVIIPKQPSKIEAVSPTLSLKTPDSFPWDISDDLYDNLTLFPDTMKMADYITSIDMAPSDTTIIAIDDTQERPDGSAIFLLKKKGETTMTVTLPVLNNLDITTEEDFSGTGGGPIVNINYKPLEATFKVEVHDNLSEFTFSPVRTITGDTVSIKLIPQPEGVEYNADSISVRVIPTIGMPENWTFAEVTGAGLDWTITPRSVGNGTINVIYKQDGEFTLKGRNTINVDQQLTLAQGWQWASFYQGSVEGKDAMKEIFSENIDEIRADNGLLYNDANYGYFGDLNKLDTLKTYKVKMKNLPIPATYVVKESTDVSTYFINNYPNDTTETGAPIPLSIVTREGWNWIGNPYQYYQKLTDIFGNTQFSEGDIIKSKTSFATYSNGAWQPELTYLTPGEGYLFKVANAGQIDFVREFNLPQQTSAPVSQESRRLSVTRSPWTIDHSCFSDNMSMIAHVGGVSDASRLTLYAFVGSECRGRGVAVGDRQFITIHGEKGERFTFCAYDELTNQFYEIRGSREFTPVSGTMLAPVPLYVGSTTTVEAILNKSSLSSEVYDLQGRRVNSTKKGIYVQRGKKVIK